VKIVSRADARLLTKRSGRLSTFLAMLVNSGIVAGKFVQFVRKEVTAIWIELTLLRLSVVFLDLLVQREPHSSIP